MPQTGAPALWGGLVADAVLAVRDVAAAGSAPAVGLASDDTKGFHE